MFDEKRFHHVIGQENRTARDHVSVLFGFLARVFHIFPYAPCHKERTYGQGDGIDTNGDQREWENNLARN